MKDRDIRRAFGDAPPEFRRQVNQMIDQLEDRPMKKRYKISVILAAALVLTLMGCAAVAAIQGKLATLFESPVNHLTNDAVTSSIQAMNESYTGNAVRCTVQEALCDVEGGTFALSWAWDNLTGEDDLYVVCDATRFGGEQGGWRSATAYVDEFFLPKETVVAAGLGELPQVEDPTRCTLAFTVLRAVGDYVQDGYGYIEVDPEYLGGEDTLYSDALIASGGFEIADRFALSFNLDPTKLGSTAKHLVGDGDFRFDGYELNVTYAEITATRAKITVEYISDAPIVDGGKGIGPYYTIDFTLPDGEYWWTGNSGADLGEPEQLPDGRWRCIYDWEAVELYTQPDELVMQLVTYQQPDGSFDIQKPIEHEEDAVTLRFE